MNLGRSVSKRLVVFWVTDLHDRQNSLCEQIWAKYGAQPASCLMDMGRG